MQRSDINIKDTWDLSLMYKDVEAFEQDLNHVQQLLQELCQFEGHLVDSAQNFLNFLEKQTLFERLISKLYCYTHLYSDVEPNNQLIKTLEAKVLSFYEVATTKLTFVNIEIIKNENTVKQLLQDHTLEAYRYNINEILRESQHILPKDLEELLTKINPIIETGSDVFNNLRLEFKPVTINGQEEFLNSATLNKFLQNKDAQVRKEAYSHFFGEYKKFENVFAKTLSSTMKKDVFIANIRHFDSALEASLFADHAPVSLFEKILYHANNKYRQYFHEYNALKKQILQLDEMYNYDLTVPLVKAKEKQYTIEESFDIILNTVKPFGKEYQDIILKAKNERWIDFYPHVGKRDGAYSGGCYDSAPYILMNFVGNYNSLTTLIHELGHSCHSYLSRTYQLPQNSDYRIFVAEVASTVNELLLINYLIDHSSDRQEKATLLYNLLEQCTGLIYRQPLFADFEHQLHQLAQNNAPMSSEVITNLYEKLNNDYFGPAVKLSEYTKYSCYYIPHFYYNYYVYKYTLGMTCALAITARILNHDTQQIDNYLNFLKSGGSKSPIELLKMAGVNPLDDHLYDEAFNYFKTKLDEFKQLMLEDNHE